MAVIGQKEIRGVTCDVEADLMGRFTVRLPGEHQSLGYADTLDGAIQQASRKLAQSKVTVAVEFFTKSGEAGVATGLHAGTGNVMARIAGKTYQLTYNENRVFDRAMPPDVLERYLTIESQRRALGREMSQIDAQWRIDLDQAVKAAIEAATQETTS